VQIVYDTYDSPIPRLADLPPVTWSKANLLHGIAFDVDAQTSFLERDLAPLLAEYHPPLDPPGDQHGFFLDNGTYSRVDAELLYAITRHFRPRRVVELGSGFSTLILRSASDANAREGASFEHSVFDPYPSALLGGERGVALHEIRAQDVPAEVFEGLGSGDILFVDTSHTVKVAGDVNFVVLDVLPRLAPGVVVHFHDIFLPFNYSRKHLEEAHFWNEQYLLQAFLVGNREWEVLVGAQAVAKLENERLQRVLPSFQSGVSPGAFWMRRVEGAPAGGGSSRG
jgi:Methyltransferase domain